MITICRGKLYNDIKLSVAQGGKDEKNESNFQDTSERAAFNQPDGSLWISLAFLYGNKFLFLNTVPCPNK